jgi:hypothetical protein
MTRPTETDRRLADYAISARARYASRPHDDRLPRVAAQSMASVLRGAATR